MNKNFGTVVKNANNESKPLEYADFEDIAAQAHVENEWILLSPDGVIYKGKPEKLSSVLFHQVFKI